MTARISRCPTCHGWKRKAQILCSKCFIAAFAKLCTRRLGKRGGK